MAACDAVRRECFTWHVVGRVPSPKVTSSGDSARTYCPVHDDTTASLSISVGEHQRIVWHCHAGCSQMAVREALINVYGISRDCLPIPKAESGEVLDQMRDLYTKGYSNPEFKWRVWSLLNGFGGELPPRGAYPGGRRGFAHDAGVSRSDIYTRSDSDR